MSYLYTFLQTFPALKILSITLNLNSLRYSKLSTSLLVHGVIIRKFFYCASIIYFLNFSSSNEVLQNLVIIPKKSTTKLLQQILRTPFKFSFKLISNIHCNENCKQLLNNSTIFSHAVTDQLFLWCNMQYVHHLTFNPILV